MESVCSYAEAFNIKATAEIRNILNKGLDLLPGEADQEPPGTPIEHGNIRGPNYYNNALTPSKEDEQSHHQQNAPAQVGRYGG